MQFLGFQIIIKRIKAIRFMMKDRSVPRRKKALIIAGLLYLVMPINLIPFAWILSIILWLWILWHLRAELDKYWLGDKEVDLSKKYRRKTVIDDVEYEIKDDKRDKGKDKE